MNQQQELHNAGENQSTLNSIEIHLEFKSTPRTNSEVQNKPTNKFNNQQLKSIFSDLRRIDRKSTTFFFYMTEKSEEEKGRKIKTKLYFSQQKKTDLKSPTLFFLPFSENPLYIYAYLQILSSSSRNRIKPL